MDKETPDKATSSPCCPSSPSDSPANNLDEALGITFPEIIADSFPKGVVKRAKKLAKKKQDKILAEAEGMKEAMESMCDIGDLLELPVKESDADKKLAFILALVMLSAQMAASRKCDCTPEFTALQNAIAALQRAIAALQQAQANLTTAQAQLTTASARERAAWRAYSAASRNTRRVCSGFGRFDPLCLVAITYEAFLGNIWNTRQQQLQAAQQAVLTAQNLVDQAEQLVAQKQMDVGQALMAYIMCLFRCVFGF